MFGQAQQHLPCTKSIASPWLLGMLNLSRMIPRMGVVFDNSP